MKHSNEEYKATFAPVICFVLSIGPIWKFLDLITYEKAPPVESRETG